VVEGGGTGGVHGSVALEKRTRHEGGNQSRAECRERKAVQEEEQRSVVSKGGAESVNTSDRREVLKYYFFFVHHHHVRLRLSVDGSDRVVLTFSREIAPSRSSGGGRF
jgi:hypothetical protein